jgi:HTH-type transcriptional regulator/antitoxin HigA
MNLRYVPAPGGTLKEKLEEMNISSIEFASLVNTDEATILGVFTGEIPITIELAQAFESVTSIPTHCWINGEKAYRKFLNQNN